MKSRTFRREGITIHHINGLRHRAQKPCRAYLGTRHTCLTKWQERGQGPMCPACSAILHLSRIQQNSRGKKV